MDDDTLFVSPDTVAQTLAEFDPPRVAAVGIPFINIRLNSNVQQHAPTTGEINVAHAFVGAAHAVRRDVFLAAGGYREHFFYMGEEGDLCFRLISHGYMTRLGAADPIHHLESPLRDLRRACFCGRRNDVLFSWHNVPMQYLVPHLLATTFNGMREAIRKGCLKPMLRGIAADYVDLFRRRKQRRPVSADIYRLHRSLKKHGPKLLSDLEPLLPPLLAVIE